MLAGQKGRHGTCSPRLDCCGAHVDLVGDLAKHADGHRKVLADLEPGTG